MPKKTFKAVRVDSTQWDKKLADLDKKDWPKVKKFTINWLMEDTRDKEQRAVKNVFVAPTPQVAKGIRVGKWATPKDASGYIWANSKRRGPGVGRPQFISDIIARVLAPHVFRGERDVKGSEARLRKMGVIRQNESMTAGDGAELNMYGNISAGQYTRMLYYFKALPPRKRKNAKTTRRKRKARTPGWSYWVADNIGPGRAIFGRKGNGPAKIIWYLTGRRPNYRRRLNFFGIAKANARTRTDYFGGRAKRFVLKNYYR